MRVDEILFEKVIRMDGEASERVEGNGSSRNPEIEQIKILAGKDSDEPVLFSREDGDHSRVDRGDHQKGLKKENKSGGDCLIDIKGDFMGKSRKIIDNTKVCRICHFGTEGSQLITLGCDCKGELGSSHPHCAEVWFMQKGDRLCEICGKTATNIDNYTEETSIFLMHWTEMRLMAATLDNSQESSRHCKQSLCKLLLVCLVLAFLLTWFFRGINIF